MEKNKIPINPLKSQLESINVELQNKKSQLKKLSEESSEKKSILNNLNNQKKDIKEKILLLNLDIEKINFEINSKQNDLISLKNLKIQINKSINFQTEILNNSKKELLKLAKKWKTYLKMIIRKIKNKMQKIIFKT